MTAPTPMLGRRLYHLRTDKEYSQEYMADRLGVTQSTYSRWEAGEVMPKLDMLKRVAEVLEVPEQQLLSPEAFFLTQHNNSGSGYIVNNQVPSEVVEKFLSQFEERFKQYDERFKGMEAL
jgi:transcriptional regulator with XRE-family HTH domain